MPHPNSWGGARQGTARRAAGYGATPRAGGAGEASGGVRTDRPRATRRADSRSRGARADPPRRAHDPFGAAGAPRLQKSCRWRRPQSKGRSCVSGRARRDLRVRSGRGHLSERPGWPSGAPIARGSTISTIAFWGRRGPHRSGRDCRIGRREPGREGCLWPDAASQGRPPDGSGLRGESIT